LGISIRAESSAQGVSQMNDGVNMLDFFTKNIFPELQDVNISARPIIKASSIKFVSTFRNQFSVEQLSALMPLLIAHLASPSVVVHTYAAFAIEKILTVKVEVQGGGTILKFGAAELRPFLESLFTSLFNVVDNVELNENQYAMKCIMRSLSVANEDVMPITQIVLERLTTVLARVAKNPRNPQFNHYMFESIAVLVRSVCSRRPEATSSFEQLLFEPFQAVLQLDVSEFTPYVFQILAQLLEYRPDGLGEAYTALFPPLMTPALWQNSGNVPALVRLLKAYLNKAAAQLVAENFLMPMLGIFQLLLSTGDTASIDLLSCLVLTVPQDAMAPALKQVFNILCTRLQGATRVMRGNKVPRTVVAITNFFALFCGKFGAKAFFDTLDSLQPGIWVDIVTKFWYPRLEFTMPVRMDAKVQIVGMTRLTCDTSEFLSSANRQEIWSRMAAKEVGILTSSGSNFGDITTDDVDIEISYASAFSSLYFARKPVDDPFPDIVDPRMFFLQSLQTFSAAHPGRVQPMLAQGLQSDQKLTAGLESMLRGSGISLV
jgi:exportin-2 (importin alpha re-exporter)